MSEVIVFAGTTEGRCLAEFLEQRKVRAEICTATEYGGQLIGKSEFCRVHSGRMDEQEMCARMREAAAQGDVFVVDATHPYAVEASENIRRACEKSGAEYIRLLRASLAPEQDHCVTVNSAGEAVRFLEKTQGNILVTTGSKELDSFTALTNYRQRVFARVLSTPEVVRSCAKMGFIGRHLICMQGPFSEELNTAMLRQFDAKWLVTKESGTAGGFAEKAAAAQRAGAGLVLIGRPVREEGRTPDEVRAYLIEKLHLSVKRTIAIVGIGMGNPAGMTLEAQKVCASAQLLVGAGRMLNSFSHLPAAKFASYRPEEIRAYVDAHPEYERIVMLQSGDVGFYSGAKGLLEAFAGEDVTLYPGISTLACLCARLHISWETVKLLSLHGRDANIIAAIREHERVFALVGNGEGVHTLCRKMASYGMGELRVTVGEELSYPTERIRTGTANAFAKETFGNLCAVLIENPGANPIVTHGIDDGMFVRGEVPMTKSEIRSISLSKLRLRRDSVIYDIGAGTGSVAVEAALQASAGRVFAIEKKAEAAHLIRENQKKFAADNLTVIEGTAPQAMEELPVPTHAFIGGSSGSLREIVTALLHKNPRVRIVINCIALETAAEALDCIRTLPVEDVDIAAVSIGKSKKAGRCHMMMGMNPVYVISMEGCVV